MRSIDSFRRKMGEIVGEIETYIEISGAGEILRRYFVMNAFDGALTMLGFVVGAYASGLNNSWVIISAGISASFAMGVSGFVGALLSEKAERERHVRELEKILFTNLEGSIVEKASNIAVVFAAIVDAIAPAIAAIAAAFPFILSLNSLIPFVLAVYLSISITLLEVFMLGLYLGKVSGGNPLKYGIYMIISGLMISLIGTLHI